MNGIRRFTVGLLALLIFIVQSWECSADETILLRYRAEENLNYLVDHNYTCTKRHKNNEVTTLRERAVVKYGKPSVLKSGMIDVRPEMLPLSIEVTMKIPDIYRLHTLPPHRKEYPTGRLTKFATGDSSPGRPWTLLELSGMFGAFPIFPEAPVTAGDSWDVKMEMCSPSNYKAIIPVTISHRLIKLEEGKTRAVIQYTFQGNLETEAHPEMLDTNLLRQIAPKYSFSGDGTVTFDVESGVVIEKEQHFLWSEVWTGRLPPSVVRESPHWEVDVDQVTSSRITARLISDDEASALIAEAGKARQTEKAGAETKALFTPKWTYHVTKTAASNDNLQKKVNTVVDRAFIGYGSDKPRIVYVDERERPLEKQTSGGARFQPFPADKLSLTGELPTFGGAGSGQSWPIEIIANSFDIMPPSARDELKPGATWEREIPMCFHSNPLTAFPATIKCEVAGHEQRKGRPCLAIRYSLAGQFRSADHPDRFTEEQRREGRAEFRMRGSGLVYLDAAEGIVVEKEQTLSWTSFAERLRRLDGGQIGWVPEVDKEESVSITLSLRDEPFDFNPPDPAAAKGPAWRYRVDSGALNSLADGTWTVQLKDVRDEIGNFHDTNTGTQDIDHYEWEVKLW